MRLILILFTLLHVALATDVNTCKSCHPIIYQEFQDSFHKKSTPKADKIHQAIWNRHPAKAKGDYRCAKCHAPSEKRSDAHQGISCITCHTITSIQEHPKSNTNIYETKDKTLYSAQAGMEDQKVVYEEKSSWFGLIKETSGSPYHDIDYRNQNFYTGKVCMGCHSHKQNGKGFDVCRIDEGGANNKTSNCITCHMPKVEGSATTIRESLTHAFHGFAGARHAPQMLSKYLKLSYQSSPKGFGITIENQAPHDLLTHPLRVVELRATLTHNGKTQTLPTKRFLKQIGTQGEASMPWLATQVVHDTMIKANEKRTITFDTPLNQGDQIEATLGYYLVNPKVSGKLGLDKEKELNGFIPLQQLYHTIP